MKQANQGWSYLLIYYQALNKLVCIGGLPRSGTTWLGTILNQNPRFYVTGPSPFVELLWRNYALWDDPAYISDLQADDLGDMRIPYLRKLTNLYYNHLTNCNIIIDNRRAWQSATNIEMFTQVFGVTPKIICPVRNVEDIISSYIKMFERNNLEWNYHTSMKGNIFEDSYTQLKESYNSTHRKSLLLVEYEDLVNNLDLSLDNIYSFIEEPRYNHDVNTIKINKSYNKVAEKYGLVGLHDTKPCVVKSSTRATDILTKDQFSEFSKLTFWRDDHQKNN